MGATSKILQLSDEKFKYQKENDTLRAERDALQKQLEVAMKALKEVKMHAHDEYIFIKPEIKKKCSGCIAEDALAEIERIEKGK